MCSLSTIKEFKTICIRITMLTTAARWLNIVFVSVHVLTEEREEEEKDKFHSIIDNTLSDIPKNSIQIFQRDFNFKTGKVIKTILNTQLVYAACIRYQTIMDVDLSEWQQIKVSKSKALFLRIKTFTTILEQCLMDGPLSK